MALRSDSIKMFETELTSSIIQRTTDSIFLLSSCSSPVANNVKVLSIKRCQGAVIEAKDKMPVCQPTCQISKQFRPYLKLSDSDSRVMELFSREVTSHTCLHRNGDQAAEKSAPENAKNFKHCRPTKSYPAREN